jgi:hypothetical protein
MLVYEDVSFHQHDMEQLSTLFHLGNYINVGQRS